MIGKREKDFRRIISRRTLLLAGSQLLLTAALGGRLYQLQVAQSSQYKRLSDRNQFDVRIVPPVRGRLFDSKMRLLAGNAESFEVRITPIYVNDFEHTLAALKNLVELSPRRIKTIREEVRKGPSFKYHCTGRFFAKRTRSVSC